MTIAAFAFRLVPCLSCPSTPFHSIRRESWQDRMREHTPSCTLRLGATIHHNQLCLSRPEGLTLMCAYSCDAFRNN